MSVLDRIRTYKLAEIAERKSALPLADIESAAREAGPVRSFAGALHRATADGYGLIAEIKRASPSKGLIREDFDVAALGKAYEAAGAACLSVLTDRPSFQGDDSFLGIARSATSLPVLRKDFLYDPWQVAESRALGADCILIILAAVSDAQAAELEAAARDWGMDSLLEVHTAEEMERTHGLRSKLVGINNRDLNTFETDTATTMALARMVPPDRMIVSESGLATRDDLAGLARIGVRCFLIGETLMRAENVEAATRDILRAPWSPQAG